MAIAHTLGPMTPPGYCTMSVDTAHDLYEAASKLPEGDPMKAELNAKQAALYGAVRAKLPSHWKAFTGSSGS